MKVRTVTNQPNLYSSSSYRTSSKEASASRIGDSKDPKGVESRKTLDKEDLLNVAVGGVWAKDMIPDINYPVIVGADAQQLATTQATLDSLPLRDVATVDAILFKEPLSTSNPLAVGLEMTVGEYSKIEMLKSYMDNDAHTRDVLIHEVGHSADFNNSLFNNDFTGRTRSDHPAFGKAPHVTEYAGTNKYEDYADSYEEFYKNPERLKEVAPEKYTILEESQGSNLQEALFGDEVARDTAKALSSFSGGPKVRMATEFVKTWGVLVSAVNGMSEVVAKGNTPFERVMGGVQAGGALGLASGLQGGAIAGGGLMSAHMGIATAQVKGELNTQALKEGDKRESARAAVVGTGSAVGGIAGGYLGPLAGMRLGHLIAKGQGGAVGLILGSVGGYLGGTHAGRKVGVAIADQLLPSTYGQKEIPTLGLTS